ncbi:MAG TPA: acyltransferase family protein [Candidatus Acidoferrales bacterium]|nr:acyltransferase family protein [Candidatus Acidoferrales bacterium]
MGQKGKQRLAYIDWMRGLACLLMFQTHCYDSWLGGDARRSQFFRWSQLGGTLPAPLFLFLAGISFALVTDGLRRAAWTLTRSRARPSDAARRFSASACFSVCRSSCSGSPGPHGPTYCAWTF